MATFYFNAAVDYDWQNLGNWWMNDTFTTPATSLPTSTDDVIAVARISTNSGSEPTVKNFTMNGDYTVLLGISITVTGTATFNNIGGFYGVTVTGNCIVNDLSFLGGNIIGDCVLNNAGTSYFSTITGNIICNGNSGVNATINGNCTFNDTSSFNGVITGVGHNVTFNDFARFSSYYGFGPFPSITGNCTFNDNSNASSNGFITGNCTFNDNSISFGVNISGNAIFNNNASVQEGISYYPTIVTNGICTFNNSSANQTIVTGDCVFNDSSLNTGTVTEDAIFNNYSMNLGSISGTATFTGQAANGGTAGTFVPASPPQILFFNAAVDNDWNNLNNWWMDVIGTIPATNLPTNVNSVIATSSILTNSGSNPTIVSLRMRASILNINITTTGLCLFITDGAFLGQWPSVTAYNSGTVTGNCLFVHNTYNTGTINGNATFYDDSFNAGTVSGNIISDGFNFYFNAAVDNDWQTLGNWWMNSGYTIPATSLPTSNDDVIAVASISANSGSAPTVANFTLNDPADTNPYLGIDITVTGLCIFNSAENYGNITGDCIFNNASSASVTITGNCTFNGTGTNYGAITGNCIFNDTATNVAGQFDPAFAITGDCTFNDDSSNSGNITANCTFNDASQNYNPITGNCTFNDSSFNDGIITGDCVFNDSSYNPGFVNGSVVYSGFTGTNSVGTFLNGKKQFYFNGAVDGEWTELGNWWMNEAFTIQATSLPTSDDDVIASAAITANSGSEPTVANFTLGGSTASYLNITITVTGTATFDDASYNSGTITGDCIFNAGTWQGGIVVGDCVFNDADAGNTITGNCIFNGTSQAGSYLFGNTINGNCIFNDTSRFGDTILTGDCTFNDYSYWDGSDWSLTDSVTGNCTFNDNSYASDYGGITGNCTANDSARVGFLDITGNCTFNDAAIAFYLYEYEIPRPPSCSGTITFQASSVLATLSAFIGGSGEVQVQYEKGINGSSILGIV